MITRIVTLTGLLSLTAGSAAAHPGDHGGLDAGGLIAHFTQEPFHAGLLLAACALAGIAFLRRRKARSDSKER